LKTFYTNVLVATKRCATIDILTNTQAAIQTTTARHACLTTLKCVPTHVRIEKSKQKSAKRLTGACGSIKDIHIVHETIHQSGIETITCPKKFLATNCAC